MLCGYVWGPRPKGRAFLSWGFLQGTFTEVRKSSRDVPGGPVVTTLSFQFGVCVCVCVFNPESSDSPEKQRLELQIEVVERRTQHCRVISGMFNNLPHTHQMTHQIPC